jgi:hypothetical protein
VFCFERVRGRLELDPISNNTAGPSHFLFCQITIKKKIMNWDQHAHPHLDELFQAQSEAHGQRAENYSIGVSNYHFQPDKPNQRKYPVSIEQLRDQWGSPAYDSVGSFVYGAQAQLFSDGYKRGFQKLYQQQSHTTSRKLRGRPESFTPELVHPHDPDHHAYETSFVAHQFVPVVASQRQIANGLRLAQNIGAYTMHHRAGEPFYAAAPGQPFRYTTTA